MAGFTAQHAKLLNDVHTQVTKLSTALPLLVGRVDVIDLDLNGRPGNGDSLGHKGRLLIVEEALEEALRARRWRWKIVAGLIVTTGSALAVWLITG